MTCRLSTRSTGDALAYALAVVTEVPMPKRCDNCLHGLDAHGDPHTGCVELVERGWCGCSDFEPEED